MSGTTTAPALRRRLRGYWKMEAANVVLLPAIAIYFSRPLNPAGAAFLLAALVPAALLLIVGALYWRASLARLEGDRKPIHALMRRLDLAQRPLLVATGGATVAAAGSLATQGWSAGSIATLAAATLGVLEYVNYFVLQLQNFDHAPDLKRFARGGGFRRAHMARDLAAYRKRRSWH